MKISIEKRSNPRVVFFYPTFPNAPKYVWFPFPYLYLSPFLEKEGFEVIIIDARVEDDWETVLSREIEDASFFGVTSMTGPDIESAAKASSIVQETVPGIPVIWGGHHAKHYPEQIIEEGAADYVFTGNGEYGLVSLLKNLVAERGIPDIQGLIYKGENGKISGNRSIPSVSFSYDIFPAYHLLNIENYRSPNNIASYFSTRGCPFKCSFCTTGDIRHSYRKMEQVEKDLRLLIIEKEFQNIFFQDGTFFISKKRVMDIAERLMSINPEVKWKAKARVNSLLEYSKEEVQYLYKSGLRSIFFGVESGSGRVLKNMNKSITKEETIASATLCHNYGFEFYASFMFATPGETVEDLKETIELINTIKSVNPNAVIQNCIYIPLPGTPMFEMCMNHDYKPPQTLKEWYSRDISSNFEKRNDINWLKPDILEEYISLYNQEFPEYRHVYEREETGKYYSPLK